MVVRDILQNPLAYLLKFYVDFYKALVLQNMIGFNNLSQDQLFNGLSLLKSHERNLGSDRQDSVFQEHFFANLVRKYLLQTLTFFL